MRSFNNLRERFEYVVSEFPDRIAIKTINDEITYSDLNLLSIKISQLLASNEVSKNDVVAIISDKSFENYASMIASIKIGSIYTNLDKDNPIERQKKIIGSAKPSAVLFNNEIDSDLEKYLVSQDIHVLNINKDKLSNYPDENINSSIDVFGSDPAYIMFTSGSTGFPKGAVISNRNVLNFILWTTQRYQITEKDRFIQLSPLYFDNSVFDFYSALFNGASLVPISKETLGNPIELMKLNNDLACTIWFSVPSLLVYLSTMRVLDSKSFQSTRVITFGGEGFPKSELKKLYDEFSHRIKLINVYGPTEGTCICSSYDIIKDDFNDMENLASLGKINPYFDYLIVNESGERVKDGEKGELLLTGENVGLGYINDQERTNISFIQNPINNKYLDRSYRTGDIVFEKNGLLFFAGRVDNQIKHMGYRIELEEIEQAINSFEFISQSGVIYHRVNENYGKIIAFAVSNIDIDENTLISKLKNILPLYMIPNIINFEETLPKNQNGKVDRNKLRSLL